MANIWLSTFFGLVTNDRNDTHFSVFNMYYICSCGQGLFRVVLNDKGEFVGFECSGCECMIEFMDDDSETDVVVNDNVIYPQPKLRIV